MKNPQESIQGVKLFFSDVVAEMRKCTWPQRQELVESTVVVIVSLILLALFVGVSDKILISVLKLLTPAG